ncbi:MAG: hypothetical protein KKG14_01775 [Alphaproteobacteria bacterium]|nr:hypothetical protein [Alphaproteobacteria bacterium]MBU2271236.1 hypothetical protein [Alphaproteobacteria bacterium]MBU2417413.1 hypothetical protein [Alphaproteobacteria bacterium]
MLKPVSPLRLPVVVAAAAGLLAASCQREAEPSAPSPAPSTPAKSAPVTPVGPVALDRRALLAAIDRAAADYAAGAEAGDASPLAGRQFDIRLAFGCEGAEASPAEGVGDGLARWSWGPERENINLSLTPGDWTRSALIAGTGQDQWEAVEGFWVARPWMAAEGCPSIRVDPLTSGAAAASPQTVGLAAVFETGSSRIGRRNGRAYAHTIRQAGDAPLIALEAGYRVRLQGRMAAFPDGQAIRCRAANPNQRPVCVAAVQLDRVAFETPTGETLSEWRPG